ncbi:MAG: CocE/NonD family hydrolase [Terracidiphilus sp.]
MLKNLLLLLVAGAAFLAAPLARSQNPAGVTVEHNVPMKTRDGVTLYADIYMPPGKGPFPVLLTRTPYNKQSPDTILFGNTAAAAGFIVVAQDVRGRYTSEGEWYPFRHEIADGYDTVEWAARLPHADGRVGMFGASYVGATQLLAATGRPPHLAAICPVVTASNYFENWTYQGGAFEQWFDESWTSDLAQDTMNRAIRADTDARIGSGVLPLSHFPVFNVPANFSGASLARALAPYFLDWLTHPTYDSYWKQWSIEDRYADIDVPTLTVAAWYDLFLGGSLRNYLGLKAHAATETARNDQRLVIAVGGHSGWSAKVGDVDFGPTADFDDSAIALDWYEYLFKGAHNEFASPDPVRVFTMGIDKWQWEKSWPPEDARETRYYLQSGGKANTAVGDGTLSAQAASANPPSAKHSSMEPPDRFVYDPANPVPTTGGPLCCDPAHLEPGARDQRAVEARRDVLVYSTPPLAEDVEVTGPVTLDLYASSSAIDTDFTGKLVDVSPDGFARNVTEGILRVTFRNSLRNSMSAPTPIVPGKIYRYTVDLWATSNVFLKGHRIRLEVSSSNFPRFARNLNTGKNAASSAKYVKATNTVYHDAAHPSALILDAIPR